MELHALSEHPLHTIGTNTLSLSTMFFIILTALMWGVTNPFIKRYTEGFGDSSPKDDGKGKTFLDDIRFLLSRPKYLVVQALNLSGTLCFNYALMDAHISVASAVANSLTLAITVVVSAMIGDSKLTPKGIVGFLLVGVGVSLMVYESQLSEERAASGVGSTK